MYKLPLVLIKKIFGTPEAIETLVADLNSRLSGELKNHDATIKAIEKDIQKNTNDIELTFKAYPEGLDPDLCRDRQEKLKLQRNELLVKLDKAKMDQPKASSIDPNNARDMFNNLEQIYVHGNAQTLCEIWHLWFKSLVI